MVKNLPARDLGLIPGLGRSPGKWIQDSYLDNSLEKGA